jgi:hypothetical protein
MEAFMNIMTIADGIVPICTSIAFLCFIIEKFNVQRYFSKPLNDLEQCEDDISKPKSSPIIMNEELSDGHIFYDDISDDDLFGPEHRRTVINHSMDIADSGIELADNGFDFYDSGNDFSNDDFDYGHNDF